MVDWWPSEAITDTDVEAVIAGGSADVMLTHDAPDGGTPKVEEIVASNPLGYSLQARKYTTEGRERMTRAFNAVKPKLLVHGHYHVYDEVTRKATKGSWGHRILSLDCENTPGNAVILDVADLSTTRLRVAW